MEIIAIDLEISADLTEKNIFDMVMNKEANEENGENQEEATKTVTSSGFNSSRNYFETIFMLSRMKTLMNQL